MRIILAVLTAFLTISSIHGQTTLWWTPNLDSEFVIKYHVYRDANADGTFPKIGEAPHSPIDRTEDGNVVSVIEFTDADGVPCFATWSWRVSADNSGVDGDGNAFGGESGFSNVTAETNLCVASDPTGLRIASAGGNARLFMWDLQPGYRFQVFLGKTEDDMKMVGMTGNNEWPFRRTGNSKFAGVVAVATQGPHGESNMVLIETN